ncbi:hypothetical protein GCM10023168_16850 [Fodinibacter luteus]|uniref:Uncharacterized protein n=1 Tax=Fodinibacter luteus TaxID=552064 RepID=A0ABP8KCX6_9MICO
MPLIRIDTCELTYPWFWLPGHLPHFVDGSVPGGVPVRLEPGEYTFQQSRQHPCDVHFRVTPAGEVDFDADQDAVLRGRGTHTLRVVGVPVLLRPTGRPVPLLPMWGGCHEPIDTGARTVRMPPGPAYEIRLLGARRTVVEFSVGRDGVVDYPEHHEGALSGRGTGTLTVDVGAA